MPDYPLCPNCNSDFVCLIDNTYDLKEPLHYYYYHCEDCGSNFHTVYKVEEKFIKLEKGWVTNA